jgi:hypothetical protein
MESSTIIDLLLREEVISNEIALAIQTYCSKWSMDVVDALLECHIMTETQLRDFLAKCSQSPSIEGVIDLELSENALSAIPYAKAKEKLWLPFRMVDRGEHKFVSVAVANPLKIDELAALLSESGLEAELFVAGKSELLLKINRSYPVSQQIQSAIEEVK